MSQRKCPNCQQLFETGDLVKAAIVTRFVALKSSVTYALERPTDCLAIAHANCQTPKGEEPEGD
jgi:hypothetical protein